MSKEEILKLVEEANILFNEGYKTLREVGEKLKLDRKTLVRNAKKIGYEYVKDKKQFIKITNRIEKESENEIAIDIELPSDYDCIPLKLQQESKGNLRVLQQESKSNLSGLSLEDISNLKEILKHKEQLLSLVEKQVIFLDLPNSDNYKTTINVNKEIWEEFLRKCENLNGYTKKDLISLAFQDFIKKY